MKMVVNAEIFANEFVSVKVRMVYVCNLDMRFKHEEQKEEPGPRRACMFKGVLSPWVTSLRDTCKKS